MSWQVTAFALLALTIVAGLAWYERSRPPARLVALVAALAALAVAGRLVLAPIPNVVATTDIALLTGYALGGPAGFVVGALAAPISNIWLGQGPWTIWQMAGWGMVGAGGAGLAVLGGRRLGRVELAAACALAGFAYGALLDLSVMVTYGGEQSLDRYLALSARGLPFNVAHAAGNAALALAAGPALVRMLERYRTRLEFRWRPASAAPLAAAVVSMVTLTVASALALAPSPGRASEGEATTLAGGGDARSWLERAQNADGGWGSAPGSSSSPAMTGWAMLGVEAGGRNPLDLRRGGRDPVDFLRSRAGDLGSTGDLERTILALEGAGVRSADFAGRDLVAQLRSRRSSSGSFEGQVNLTAFGVLALKAAGAPGSELGRSASWLRHAQNNDGGWGFRPGAASDADSTGAALQALAAAGAGGSSLREGAGFLRGTQGGDGGWALGSGGASNSQSTAWAVQGLVAAGAPAGGGGSGADAFDYLAARQADDGHYRYSSSSDQTPVWVTGQAMLAIERQAFPLSATPRSRQPGGLPPVRRGDGGPAGRAEDPVKTVRGDPVAGSAAGGGGGRVGAGHRRGRRGDRERDGGAATKAKGAAGPAAPGALRAREPLAGQPGAAEAGGDGEGPGPREYVAGGLGLLAATLGAGWLWRRRPG